MALIDWQAILAKLYEVGEVIYFKEQFARLKSQKFGINWIILLVRIMKDLIIKAEWICLEAEAVGVGEEKRKAVQAFLERVINLPFPLSLFKGTIISLLISVVVQFLNLEQGKNWVQNYSNPTKIAG